MNYFWRFVIILTLFLFILPAILFSVLVLGLTDSSRSGTAMFVTSLILMIVVYLFDRNIRPPHRGKKNGFHPIPPSLSELYQEIISKEGGKEDSWGEDDQSR
ncbi:hypothetical protein [Paenibacillus harenae]|uniref:hypothetical protein n=1 Tax=Paenibacillus harenae TaxID=306543 RepID=UPI00041A340A|nr:hypothetical protein [Paenibacillus harenae]